MNTSSTKTPNETPGMFKRFSNALVIKAQRAWNDPYLFFATDKFTDRCSDSYDKYSCRLIYPLDRYYNGVIAVGESGSGKTSVLTSLAEAMIHDRWGGLILSRGFAEDTSPLVQDAQWKRAEDEVIFIDGWKPGMEQLVREGKILVVADHLALDNQGEKANEARQAIFRGFIAGMQLLPTGRPAFAFVDEALPTITYPSKLPQCAVLTAATTCDTTDDSGIVILLRTHCPKAVSGAARLLDVSEEKAAVMLGSLRCDKRGVQGISGAPDAGLHVRVPYPFQCHLPPRRSLFSTAFLCAATTSLAAYSTYLMCAGFHTHFNAIFLLAFVLLTPPKFIKIVAFAVLAGALVSSLIVILPTISAQWFSLLFVLLLFAINHVAFGIWKSPENGELCLST